MTNNATQRIKIERIGNVPQLRDGKLRLEYSFLLEGDGARYNHYVDPDNKTSVDFMLVLAGPGDIIITKASDFDIIDIEYQKESEG